MSNGVQLQIGGIGRAIIQHEDGALLIREKLLDAVLNGLGVSFSDRYTHARARHGELLLVFDQPTLS
jgi:hypothetical protein